MTFLYPRRAGDLSGAKYAFDSGRRLCIVATWTDEPTTFDPLFAQIVQSIRAET